MSGEKTPLDKLRDAITEFVNAEADEPIIVDNMLVAWEEVTLAPDGTALRRMMYSIPSDNYTLSGTLGLIRYLDHRAGRDLLSEDD